MALPRKSPLVVGLGEALFDCFPDRQVLGGAPINFAVHAAALLAGAGGRAVAATRVGADELGDRITAELADRGVATDAVQRDPHRPTGRVDVTLDPEGEPSYAFLPNSAWDALACDEAWRTLAAECDAVTFGTLAQRTDASRTAIREFLTAAPQALRLFDANLRQNFYSPEVLEESFQLANAVKLNEDELVVVTRELGLPTSDPARLVESYALHWLVVTKGQEGMTRYTVKGERHDVAPAPFDPWPDADLVGAGDACCAGLVCGELLGLSTAKTLDLATRLGAYVAERPGATPALPEGFTLAPGQ